MNLTKFKFLLSLTLIGFLLHTAEEYFTKLYNLDPFIVGLADRYQLNPIGIFILIQILILILIITLLILASHQKFNKTLAIILGLVFFVELLHPYDSLKIWAYYSGLYTGLILLIIGYFYWKELIKQLGKK